MDVLEGFPFFEVHIKKDGVLHRPGAVRDAAEELARSGATDLVVVSHGWNNDAAEARELYGKLLRSLRLQRRDRLAGATIAVAGVFWPSKKFADRDLIPAGGAVAMDSTPDAREALRAQLGELADFFDAADAPERLARARDLVDDLQDPQAQDRFMEALSGLVVASGSSDDDLDPRDLTDLEGREVFVKLGGAALAPSAAGEGGAASMDGAAGLMGDLFHGAQEAARKALNLITYYQMKERAGLVGRKGILELLRSVRAASPNARLHLVGHSFGGRAVTSACAAAVGSLQIDSLTLLQAAFSHNGFAQDFDAHRDGAFRGVIQERVVRGPILVTHTHNDKAVGLAYALASRLAGQDAAGVGGRDDRFGGIGANGAQHTPEAVDVQLLEAGRDYALAPGALFNLHAGSFIRNHGDVAGEQVAHALWSAVELTALDAGRGGR